jgi:hypothetical protein
MVMDNAQVTVYVECTNREYKQYKVHFIVKKPGSSLIAPIVRMAGISNPHSVVVNGVDTGDDFAFSPNMAVFDKNLELVQANYQSRPLNGNVALGYAYHDLVMKSRGAGSTSLVFSCMFFYRCQTPSSSNFAATTASLISAWSRFSLALSSSVASLSAH